MLALLIFGGIFFLKISFLFGNNLTFLILLNDHLLNFFFEKNLFCIAYVVDQTIPCPKSTHRPKLGKYCWHYLKALLEWADDLGRWVDLGDSRFGLQHIHNVLLEM